MKRQLADLLGQAGEELANCLIDKWPRHRIIERGNRATEACIDSVVEGRSRAIWRKINRSIAIDCRRCALSTERELHMARRCALSLLRRCAIGALHRPNPNICTDNQRTSIPAYFFGARHRLLQYVCVVQRIPNRLGIGGKVLRTLKLHSCLLTFHETVHIQANKSPGDGDLLISDLSIASEQAPVQECSGFCPGHYT